MLLWLSIRDFVLVEKLDIEFSSGFTVLTGETGAGKSILLDAIGLLLGDRFDKRQLREGATKIELSAGFEVSEKSAARQWLMDSDFLDENEPSTLMIRRTQDAQNKSRAWINGKPAMLGQLAALGDTLIELHGQHEHQTLSRAASQRERLDDFAKTGEVVKEVGRLWRVWQDAKNALDAAQNDRERSERDRAWLTERLLDLSAIAPLENEWEVINARHRQASHADSLIAVAEEAQMALMDSEGAIDSALSKLAQKLRHESEVEPLFGEWGERIESAALELSDVARELRDYARKTDRDPETLEQITRRIAALFDASRKYRVPPEKLPELLTETEEALAKLARAADVEALCAAALEAETAYRKKAAELSLARQAAAKKLNVDVTEALAELSMAGGRFEVLVTEFSENRAESHGINRVEFCIAAHPAQPLAPLSEVASGGELSRIALALLTVLAKTAGVPTMIFDEIDTGVGGSVGFAIGQKLRALGKTRQVLCVTHLPQVAACAVTHDRVEKKGDARHVHTELVPLTEKDRVEEIARMLGGAAITATTRSHAKELLKNGASLA